MIKVIGLNIRVLKKEPFSGSHQGMRFFMRAEDDTLHVWVYPEPWCFEKTSDDMKTAKDFPAGYLFDDDPDPLSDKSRRIQDTGGDADTGTV